MGSDKVLRRPVELAQDSVKQRVSSDGGEIGSRPFGNIGIASTDSASHAMTEAAIEEAHRAVSDLQ